MRRQKSFAWYYFLFLMSSGVFAVYWLYSLMEDVNAAARRTVFRSKLVIAPVLVGWIGVLVGLVFVSIRFPLLPEGVESAFVYVAIFTEVALVMTTVWVYGGILELEGKPLSLSGIGFAVGTFILMGFIFPYMQIRANEHLAPRGPHEASAAAAR